MDEAHDQIILVLLRSLMDDWEIEDVNVPDSSEGICASGSVMTPDGGILS